MISVEFDEYVNVRQLNFQLLVSPPLTKSLECRREVGILYFTRGLG